MRDCSDYPPIFIGGMGRSGTTLLVDLLGLHPLLSPIYETNCVVTVAEILFVSQIADVRQATNEIRQQMYRWSQPLPHLPDAKADYERYHHGAHHVLFSTAEAMTATDELIRHLSRGDPKIKAYRHFIETLFTVHCRHAGKRHWVNKTPGYIRILPILANAFPKLRFLYCVRDPRDVVGSIYRQSWNRFSQAEIANHWVQSAIQADELEVRFPGQLLEIKYETLIDQPERTLTEVCEWLSMPSNDSHSLLRRMADLRINFDKSRIRSSRNRLKRSEIDMVETTAGEIMQRMGYL